MNNENLQPGEDVYFWEEGKDNYDFGTIKSDEHAYLLIDHILERNAHLPATVHKSRVSRDRMEIIKLIASAPIELISIPSHPSPMQMELF